MSSIPVAPFFDVDLTVYPSHEALQSDLQGHAEKVLKIAVRHMIRKEDQEFDFAIQHYFSARKLANIHANMMTKKVVE